MTARCFKDDGVDPVVAAETFRDATRRLAEAFGAAAVQANLATRDGVGDVVAGLGDKAQAARSAVTPQSALAEQHRRVAEPERRAPGPV